MPVLPKEKQAPARRIVVVLCLLQKTKMKQYDQLLTYCKFILRVSDNGNFCSEWSINIISHTQALSSSLTYLRKWYKWTGQ